MSWLSWTGRRILRSVETGRNKWLIAISISIGSLMGAVDASIVNVAMPQIQGAVGASLTELTWISTAYTMALVVLMPLASYLARRVGQKRLYLACLALFILGSVLAGLQSTLPGLVACRVVQGLGAGVLQPTEQAILRETFPKNEQGMAMAIFGVVVMTGPAIGPSLGGLILEYASWSWIFFLSVPVGILGFVMVSAVLTEDPELAAINRRRAIAERANTDWAGMVFLTVALALGEWVLEEGASVGWFDSRWVASATAVVVASLAGFFLRELTAPAPVMDLRLFRDRTYAAGVTLNATLMALLLCTIFLQPLFMEQVLGLTPMDTATMLLPRSLVMMVGMVIVGSLTAHVSARVLLLVGIGIFFVGALDMSHLTAASGTAQLVRSSAIQGLGFAFLFVPMETATLSGIPKARIADATAVSSLVSETGGAVGLAIMSVFFERNGALAYSAVAAQIAPARAFWFPASMANFSREVAVLSYERTFELAAFGLVGLLPLVLLLRPAKAEAES